MGWWLWKHGDIILKWRGTDGDDRWKPFQNCQDFQLQLEIWTQHFHNMDIQAHIGFQAQQGHGKNSMTWPEPFLLWPFHLAVVFLKKSSEKAIDVAETHDFYPLHSGKIDQQKMIFCRRFTLKLGPHSNHW